MIEGEFSDRIKRYHIIDCRFGYEFEGGHIDGALNVKSMDALDELLLSEASGVHADGKDLPVPSRSGELPDGQQVVLIFHCEFSAKRAPTLYVTVPVKTYCQLTRIQCQTPAFP